MQYVYTCTHVNIYVFIYAVYTGDSIWIYTRTYHISPRQTSSIQNMHRTSNNNKLGFFSVGNHLHKSPTPQFSRTPQLISICCKMLSPMSTQESVDCSLWRMVRIKLHHNISMASFHASLWKQGVDPGLTIGIQVNYHWPLINMFHSHPS